MKLLICFTGSPGLRGPKVREFYFLPEHGLFVWQKRELSAEEFNREAKQVFERNVDLRPYAKVVVDADEVSARHEADRLTALIGKPPTDSHPSEAAPRAETWHQERLNWMGEVVALRAQVKSALKTKAA